MRPIAKQLGAVLVILVILALLGNVIAERRAFSQLALIIVIGSAFVTGLNLVLGSTNAMIAWIAASVIVPCFLLLLGVAGSSEPEKFVDIAYLFGALYGGIAGGIGVLVGMVVRRRRIRARGIE
jgi:hypothetical protein